MKKSHLVALVAAFCVLLLSMAAAFRVRHTLAANLTSARHSIAAAAHKHESGSDDEQMVIRFAKNPAPMPPFLVTDLDGNLISTAALRGKVVIVNFWATWCPPCRDEIPEMIELANRYKDKLQIIAVSQDDASPAEVKQFAREIGINYPIVMGSNAMTAEYGGVPALPTTFVVNTDGRIVQKHEGLYPTEVYDEEVRSLLGMPVDVKVETFEDTGQIFLKNAVRATELPGVSFKGLTPQQKQAALKRMNSQMCTCGCKPTIAQCRINDSACSVSKDLAEKIVKEIASSSPVKPAAAIRN
jgi:thiol-disulfide isomerase/thioredoxin